MAKAGAATTDASSSNAPTTIVSLVNPADKDAATLKVVWASQLYGVPLEAASSSPLVSSKKPALVYGTSHVVAGGGNAMALAVADMSQTAHRLSLTEGLLCDEWCEWERTVLRPALGVSNPKKAVAALQYLEGALQGVHLAGTRETLADVVVVSTLVVLVDKLPADWATTYPGIHRMVTSHHTAIETAQEAISAMVAKTSKAMPEIDLNEASLYQLLTNIFRNAVETLLQDMTGENMESFGVKWSTNAVTKCGNAKHGDYQCSAAMFTFAALKKAGALPVRMVKPQDFAKHMIESLGPDHPVLTDLGLNGPGFVVCRVRDTFLQDRMNQFLQKGKLPVPQVPAQTCVVDFSSPNIAKEMHVGHLRSTIIGETVCRVLEYVGHKVHRVNHVGDWGTQFGMLIQYLREEYPDAVSKDDGVLPNITDLTLFYKSAKVRFDESPEFKKASQLNVVQLQAGDPECTKIWQMLCDVSRREFEKVYKRLEVTLTEFGESFYNSRIPPVIEELVQKEIVQQEEGGAKIAWLQDFPSPLMLQKTDGGFGYDSTDMAALKYRLHELKADRIIIITDYSQGNHFGMIYNAGRKAGWVDRGQRLEHIGFGTVNGPDGKPFKTRSGDTVRLVDLLDEAVSRMKASLEERNKEGKSSIAGDELNETAAAMGYSAVRYFDLKRNPTSNYNFSYDAMLDTKGDTAVYLLFATARLDSIATKAKAEHGVDVSDLLKSGEPIVLTHPSERNLALHIHYFTDTVLTTLDNMYPYYLCEYVYKLSIAATDFVTNCRVLGSPEMKSRLLLCHATTLALHEVFDLIGIHRVKRI